jgi:four helix bundle protein
MSKFRFEDLEIWQFAINIGDKLFDIADNLELRKLYRFADQLRGACMSMSNNIAEGSGSSSNNEFRQYLNVAHRSTFENAKYSFHTSSKKDYRRKRKRGFIRTVGYFMQEDYKISKFIKLNTLPHALCTMRRRISEE